MFTALQISVVMFMLTVVATAGFFIVGALLGIGSVLLQAWRALRRAPPVPAPVAVARTPRRPVAERASPSTPRREPVVPA